MERLLREVRYGVRTYLVHGDVRWDMVRDKDDIVRNQDERMRDMVRDKDERMRDMVRDKDERMRDMVRDKDERMRDIVRDQEEHIGLMGYM